MDILNKAKEILEVASCKTERFINEQKDNLRIAGICNELKRDYERLGRLCYRKIKGLESNDNEFDSIIEDIEILKMELDALRTGNFEDGDFESIVFEDGEEVKNEKEE